MSFNNITTRSDAGALIPEAVSSEIIQGVPEASAVLRLGRRLPNMTRAQLRIPVLSSLITAGFVNGDTGLKATASAEWENKYINAEELAVIVPIPEKVLDDADYDLWSEIRPRIIEAFGIAIDSAALFNTNAPSSWPTGLVAGAVAASNSVTYGTGADLYEDVMSENGVIAKVEEDGYYVTGHIATMVMRSRLRGLRDANGQPLFMTNMQGTPSWALDGAPVEFPRNGAFDAATALMISGDFDQLVYAIRQDITYKMLSEAVIQDAGGNIIYNLAQQDMVALRVVMRLGWQIPNPINRLQPTEASRYPFAVLVP